MSNIQMIPLAEIDTASRMRGSYDRPVAALVASIRDCAEAGVGHDGLRHPIEVRARGEQYVLVSGLHRLRAFEAMERTEIAAFVLEVDDIQAAQLELEENLVRADLNALDRALFVKRFREMFEAEHGAIARGGAQEFSPRSWQTLTVRVWSKDAPERLAMSIHSIERCLKIANGLHPDAVRALRDTDWSLNHSIDWTNNQKGLLELSSVPAHRQAEVVSILAAAPAFSMRDAIAKETGSETRPPAAQALDKWVALTAAPARVRQEAYKTYLVRDMDCLRTAFKAEGFAIVPIGPATTSDIES